MYVNDIVDDVTSKIINKIDFSWNKLEKIRFIYLELGKYLEKNSDFFLNDKLDDLRYSKDEIEEIYAKDKIYISKKADNSQAIQIICKSGALFLKYALDKLNIESHLIHTTGNVDSILHWFLVVKDDNNNQYFLTISADLPYIKNDLPTKHFGSAIKYINDFGKQMYVVPENSSLALDNNGGIKHTILNKETLKKIDNKIGSDKLYSLDNINLEKEYNKLFITSNEENTIIYDIFDNCFNLGLNKYKRIDEIKIEEIRNFKIQLNNYIGDLLDKKLFVTTEHNTDDHRDFLHAHIIMLLEQNRIKLINYSSDIYSLLKDNKDFLGNCGKDTRELLIVIQTLIIIEDRFDKYLKDKEEYDIILKKINDETFNNKSFSLSLSLENLVDELYIKTKELEISKKNLSIIKLRALLNLLSSYFVKDIITFNKDKYISMQYIVNKFCDMFPKIIDCNYSRNHTRNVTDFSVQNYSEQVIIIKEILKDLFSELNYKNCCNMENYNDSYSPVENRIQTFPLKNRETGEYCIGFCFKRSGNSISENDLNYIYIPSANLLRERDVLLDFDKYLIVSRRFNDKLEKIEDIDIVSHK